MNVQIAGLLLFLASGVFGQKVSLLSPELNPYANIRDFCISSTGDEAFFSIQSPNQELSQLVVVKNKKWHRPVLLSFCDGYSYLEPFLSADGQKLYFASNRPKNETDTLASDFDLWYVERKNKKDNWSKPINMGTPVNSGQDEFYPSLADNGNLYFTMDSKSGLGKDDIYCCTWDGTHYARPVLLPRTINGEGYEFNAFISKDERFILYTRYNSTDGFGSGDLYISRKNEDGEWKRAENMGGVINTKYMEYCPFYDSQTNTLYFTSKVSNLLPGKFRDLKQYLETITGSQNGLSKIYRCTLKL